MTSAVEQGKGLGWRPGRATLLLFGLSFALLIWRGWVITHAGITLYVDEAQYWTWAQKLDWGYFSKPPGVALLIAVSTALFGDDILGVKALAALCYPLAAAAAWRLARRLYNEETAFWSSLVILTVPIFSWLGLFVSTDALLTLFWTLALWIYLRVLDQDNWSDWLGLGFVCGLGLLSKYTLLVWMAAALLHLLVFHRSRLNSPKPWIATLLAIVILAPNLAWNIFHDFPTLKHTADITLHRQNAGNFAPLGEFWGAQWVAFGPVFGSIVLWLMIPVRSNWQDPRRRLLLWFALPLWAVVSLQALKGGANANWAAPAFVPAAIAVVAWLLQNSRKMWLVAGLSINLLIVATAYHWPQWSTVISWRTAEKLNPYRRAAGWDELGRQLKPLLGTHRDAVLIADNRTLLAHMLYELRELRPIAASWNPSGVASDHFKLTTDLRPHVGRDALLITESSPSDEIARRFVSVNKLADLKASISSHSSRTMSVYLMRNFKGY